MTLDELDRPVLASDLRQAIDNAFEGVDGRGAMIIVADETGTRAHLAAKLGDHWKVAAGGGIVWADPKPVGFVGVQWVW